MLRLEFLALAIGNLTGGFDSPDSRAFKLRNPLLLKTYRPEKKCDSEHYRIFSSISGGLKAGVSDLASKSSGKNHRLSQENTLKDLLTVYGMGEERAARRILLFLRKALEDDTIELTHKLSWLHEEKKTEVEECQ
jgi:hypothetical protein